MHKKNSVTNLFCIVCRKLSCHANDMQIAHTIDSHDKSNDSKTNVRRKYISSRKQEVLQKVEWKTRPLLLRKRDLFIGNKKPRDLINRSWDQRIQRNNDVSRPFSNSHHKTQATFDTHALQVLMFFPFKWNISIGFFIDWRYERERFLSTCKVHFAWTINWQTPCHVSKSTRNHINNRVRYLFHYH